jgi:rubrerythrin
MNPYYKDVFANGQNNENARTVFSRVTPQPDRPPDPSAVMQPTGVPSPAQNDIYSYPQNLKDALDMLQDAISGEAQDRVFSEFLVNAAPTQQDRTIIQGMIQDEMEHYLIFRQIYTELSGKEAPVSNPQNVVPGIFTYCEGLQLALMADDQDITDYGKILFALQDRRTVNMMTRVLLDEIRHTSLINFLYSKNRCSSQSNIEY